MILPIFAGLERVPDSLLEASGDLGAATRDDAAPGRAADGLPGRRRRLDLHVLADAGRLHRRADRRRRQPAARQRRLRQRRRGQQPAVRRGGRDRSRSSSCCSTSPRCGGPAPWTTCERRPDGASRALRLLLRDHGARAGVHLRAAGAGGAQLLQRRPHLHLAAAGLTLQWWTAALAQRRGPRRAAGLSVEVALLATAIALVLGTMAALALQRFRFFGRDTVSLLIILPIALPGIVTGIALANAFRTMLGIELGFFTLVVAHATFCIVTVFNNVHGAAAAARRQPRGGLDGPRRRTVPDVPAGHVPDAALGRCSPARCWRSGCPSTRSS